MKQQNGFVMLLSVIIIGALGVTLALYLLSASMLSYQGNGALVNATEARYLADSCGELALAAAPGCGTISFTTTTFGGSCAYTITSSGSTRTVQVNALFRGSTRRLTATVDFSNAPTTPVAWQEVAHF